MPGENAPGILLFLGVNRVMVSWTSPRRKFWKTTYSFSNEHSKMTGDVEMIHHAWSQEYW